MRYKTNIQYLFVIYIRSEQWRLWPMKQNLLVTLSTVMHNFIRILKTPNKVAGVPLPIARNPHADSWRGFPAKIKSQPHVLQQLGRRQRRGSYMHRWGINNRKFPSRVVMYGHRWYGGLPAAAWRFDRPFHMTVLRVSEVSEASVYRILSGLTLSNRYVKGFLVACMYYKTHVK